MPRSFLGSGVALDHAGDYGVMRDLHRAVNPTVMLGMVDGAKDIPHIKEFKNDLPGIQIIGRVYHPEEGGYAQKPTAPGDNRAMIATPEDVLEQQIDLGHDGMWLHVMNEPSMFLSPDKVQLTIDWLIKFIRLAAPEKCACVLGNLADMHPAIINGMWDPITWPFLQEAAKYPDLIKLGLHFYGPDKITAVITALNETCKHLGIVRPDVVGTEFGMDSMGQGDKANGYHIRGLNGEQFLRWQASIIQGDLKPFIASGQLLGLLTFEWNVLWGPFSTAQDQLYQKTYKAAALQGDLDVDVVAQVLNPPVVIPPVELDESYTISTPGAFINLRATPSNDADIMGAVPDQAVVLVLDEQEVNGDTWRKVKYLALTGYIPMRSGSVKLTRYVAIQQPVTIPAQTTPAVKTWNVAFPIQATDPQKDLIISTINQLLSTFNVVGQPAGVKFGVVSAAEVKSEQPTEQPA